MAEGAPDNVSTATTLSTLSQLRSLVYAPLRDSERSFVESWFVDALLNEAYLDLNARLRLKRLEVTGTTTSLGKIAIPSDLIEVMDAWVGTTPLVFHDDATFETYTAAGTTPYLSTNSVAVLARVDITLANIETYPAAVSTAYTLHYVARPAVMVAEDDTPAYLSAELLPRIVNYARAHAKWQEGEEQEGQRYMAMYEQGLPGAPREMARRRPQSIMLIPEAGPFG